jgi:hypothetical protein
MPIPSSTGQRSDTLDGARRRCNPVTPAGDGQPPRARFVTHRRTAVLLLLLLGACALQPQGTPKPAVRMPLLSGWFNGEIVHYVTTDVSDANVAKEKGANFAPRIGLALAQGSARPGQGAASDKVYAVTNFEQGSVFASAPAPMGFANADAAYSPLWQMVTVTWRANVVPRTLKSEEDVLAAAERRDVSVLETSVVLNCPIVHRGPRGGLPGVRIE